MTIEVTVQDGRESPDDEVPPSTDFHHWINLAIPEGTPDAGITIRIVDSDESRQLNQQYRNQDRPTNVLSFAYDDNELLSATGTQPLLGDLVICADVVQSEATDKGCPLHDHWAHMTIHGVLHLLGHEHETREQAEEMESLEKRLLASISIADPYEMTRK